MEGMDAEQFARYQVRRMDRGEGEEEGWREEEEGIMEGTLRWISGERDGEKREEQGWREEEGRRRVGDLGDGEKRIYERKDGEKGRTEERRRFELKGRRDDSQGCCC